MVVTYQVMVGIGEPKEAQWSKAGLLVITWYTLLGGVRTLGGSAVGDQNTGREWTVSEFTGRKMEIHISWGGPGCVWKCFNLAMIKTSRINPLSCPRHITETAQ